MKEIPTLAKEWSDSSPHHRWFRDYYKLSPLDDRYLDMTEYDILFDFYTIYHSKEKQKNEEITITEPSGQPNLVKNTIEVSANEEDFNNWLKTVKHSV